MTKIIYDNNIIKFMSLFETLTKATLKDCIADDERLIFIVQENDISKAIGKYGSNVKKMESILKKRIKIVEFSNDVLQFIKNFIYPITVKEVKKEGNTINIIGGNIRTKGLIIGRDQKNLKNLESIAKRYFNIGNIKVL